MSQFFVSEGRCQFCHSTARDVEHLVAGDSGLICNECVTACAALLQQGQSPSVADERPDRFVFDRLTRLFPLPDGPLRRRLIGLYAGNLPVPAAVAGASAVRKARRRSSPRAA